VPSSRASLHQAIAFLLLYPRLVGLVVGPPCAILSVPLFFCTINWLTAGHALVTFLLAILAHNAALGLLSRLATTPEQLAKGLARNQVRLPVLALVICICAVRSLVQFVLGQRFASHPSMTLLASIFGRAALSVLVWELATLLRYVGPPSMGTCLLGDWERRQACDAYAPLSHVLSLSTRLTTTTTTLGKRSSLTVRCSSMPLVSNPFASFVHYWWKFPLFFLIPATADGESRSPSLYPTVGRRYQYPSFSGTLAQVLTLSVLGAALFLTSLPLLESMAPMEATTATPTMALLVISLVTILLPLVPYVHGLAHELDPRVYLHFTDAWLASTASDALLWALMQGSAVACVAYLVQVLVSTERLTWSWTTAVALLLWATLGVWIPRVWEQILRLVLFVPRTDVTRDVLGITDGCPRAFLRVVLRSLLLEASLVEAVLPTSSTAGLIVWQLNENELRLVFHLSQTLGQQLLQKMVEVEAPLEEDVLRWNLLQALGGGTARGDWLLESNPRSFLGKGAPEPPAATLVRGLCVVVGGMGVALQRIHATAVGGRYSRGKLDTWTLSAGALLSLKYTLTALDRFLAPTKGSPRTAPHLTSLVPAALASLHALYVGLVQYRMPTPGGLESPPHAELLQTLLRSCAETAVAVLSRVAPKGPVGTTGLSLNKEVVAWLQGEACQDLYPSRM
jgi:hypothetical protein